MRIKRDEPTPVMAYYKDDKQSWAFSPPEYKEAFKDELKEQIPYDKREWDRVNKLWIIHEDYSETMEELFAEYFPDHQLVWAEEGEEYDYVDWSC